MNLSRLLGERAAAGNPVRVGLIGAGKFGSMFLAQARRTAGLQVLGVADLSPDRARDALARVGWPAEQYAAATFAQAWSMGATCITDDATALIAADGLDVVIDATGSPAAGIRHALLACTHGRHIVMVNVEADVLAGPLLAQRARRGGSRLFDGLWRSAGADLRDGRLGARRRVSTWSPPARAPSICPLITRRRRRRSGGITG